MARLRDRCVVALIALQLVACGTIVVDPGDRAQVQAWHLNAADRTAAVRRVLAELTDIAAVATDSDRVQFAYREVEGQLEWGCARSADQTLYYPAIRLRSRGLATLSPRRLWHVTRFAARFSRLLKDELDKLVPSATTRPDSCPP